MQTSSLIALSGVVVVVALAYGALSALSALVAYAPTDAWTVWLASGMVFGALLALPRAPLPRSAPSSWHSDSV
jgi:hypothetical protein